MGYTYATKHENKTIRQFLEDEIEGPGTRVLACSCPTAEAAYLAIQHAPRGAGQRSPVFACVCLLDGQPQDHSNDRRLTLGYKPVDEREGPRRYGCPARILDLLSETDNTHALSWRAKCRERLQGAAR